MRQPRMHLWLWLRLQAARRLISRTLAHADVEAEVDAFALPPLLRWSRSWSRPQGPRRLWLRRGQQTAGLRLHVTTPPVVEGTRARQTRKTKQRPRLRRAGTTAAPRHGLPAHVPSPPHARAPQRLRVQPSPRAPARVDAFPPPLRAPAPWRSTRPRHADAAAPRGQPPQRWRQLRQGPLLPNLDAQPPLHHCVAVSFGRVASPRRQPHPQRALRQQNRRLPALQVPASRFDSSADVAERCC